MEKIELTPNKIIKGATTVWNEPGLDVDITMDLKKLSFKKGSIKELYSFHVLDHLFPNEIQETVNNWFSCLAPEGKLCIIVDDFEYLARAMVGGDLSIQMLNELHSHPTQFTRDFLYSFLKEAGFKDDKIVIWLVPEVGDKFLRNHYELVLEATKI